MKRIYRGGKNNTVVLLAYNRQNFEQIAFDAVYAKNGFLVVPSTFGVRRAVWERYFSM